jgi:sugar/nucleoside kinase (ribokinase family)
MRRLRLTAESPFRVLVGVGGIGAGIFLVLEGNDLLGRNESRAAHFLDVRDYCKLHIVAHYVAALLGADPSGVPFRVVPLGLVGDDTMGHRLLGEMRAVGMETAFVGTLDDRPTLSSVCFQYPDGSGGNITMIDSAAARLDAGVIYRAAPILAAAGDRAIALALPEVTLEARRCLLDVATETGAFRVASFTSSEIPDARRSGLLGRVDLLALNEDEAAVLTGRPFDKENPLATLDHCATILGAAQPDMRILVSAGAHGAFAFADGRWEHCPAPAVPVVSTAGGGDALLAGVLAALAVGVPFITPLGPSPATRTTIADRPLQSALAFGVLLATYSVTSPHTIHPDADLGALVAFAQRLGATFAGVLARVIDLQPPAGHPAER